MGKCQNCLIEVYLNADGKWCHVEGPNCGQPEPLRYPPDNRDKEIDRVIRKKEAMEKVKKG